MSNTVKSSFSYAFKQTIPIMMGFIFLGITYGLYMNQNGFNFLYPTSMAFFIFGGSIEFVVADLLLKPFNPVNIFMLTLIINSRHFFYGLSMLEKYSHSGWKKYYLIFGMCDESFSINYSTKIPSLINSGYFMFFVTLLNHFYWVFGAFLGGILGSYLTINLEGMSFVMTALFIVLFVDQLLREDNHLSSILGITISMILLFLVGKTFFLPLSMILVILIFPLINKKELSNVND